MKQRDRESAKPNRKAHHQNFRSTSESKLSRRQFALPIEEQRRILQEYRDRGLAFGRATN